MSRSVTVALPSTSGLARTAGLVIVALVLVALGIRVGLAALSPGPAAEFGRGVTLQQIVTPSNTFVGHIVGDDGTYVRLANPAIVRDASNTGSSQLIVQLLVVNPFDLKGDILVPRAQVVLIGNVEAGSGLEKAYRQAKGELPQESLAPAPSATP